MTTAFRAAAATDAPEPITPEEQAKAIANREAIRRKFYPNRPGDVPPAPDQEAA